MYKLSSRERDRPLFRSLVRRSLSLGGGSRSRSPLCHLSLPRSPRPPYQSRPRSFRAGSGGRWRSPRTGSIATSPDQVTWKRIAIRPASRLAAVVILEEATEAPRPSTKVRPFSLLGILSTATPFVTKVSSSHLTKIFRPKRRTSFSAPKSK